MAPVAADEGRSYPALLNIHGGPFTQYGNHFFDEFQLQAAAGYAAIYANPRGSSGYSEAWGRAIRWPECELDPGSGWGGVDHDDRVDLLIGDEDAQGGLVARRRGAGHQIHRVGHGPGPR